MRKVNTPVLLLLALLLGAFLPCFAQTPITLGGKDVPLFFVGASGPEFEQVNAQVPFDLAPGTTPSLVVT